MVIKLQGESPALFWFSGRFTSDGSGALSSVLRIEQQATLSFSTLISLFSVGRGRQCYTTKCNALVNSQFTVAVILPLSQVTFHFLNALTNLITDNFHAPNVSAHVKKTRIIIFFFNVFVFRFHLLSYFLWLLWQNYRKITLILFVGSFMLHRTWMDTFVITKYS